MLSAVSDQAQTLSDLTLQKCIFHSPEIHVDVGEQSAPWSCDSTLFQGLWVISILMGKETSS